MVEGNGQDVHVPWFSGICLEGEVAGQYEMEPSSSLKAPGGEGVPGVLALDGLAPITIFVGANNSGKSRLMRELFQTQELSQIKLKSRDSEGKEVDEFGSKFPTLANTKYAKVRQVASAFKDNWIVASEIEEINSYMADLSATDPDSLKKSNFHEGSNYKLGRLFLTYTINGKISGFQDRKCQYIPMLRGMRPLLPATSQVVGGGVKDFYKQRTIHDYFSERNAPKRFIDGSETRYSIFSGLTLYDNLRRRLLARTQAERKSVHDYECFLSTKFFPGQSVTLIPVEEGNNDVVHIRIGDKDERPIYDLGDGMQSLIICTYPIVTETEKGSLFFLEEPDLCMHPSLQRTFLEVLKTYHYKMGHQFFITTHSNHLLDLLEDNELVSIFSFSEIADRAGSPADPSQAGNGANSKSSKPEQPRFRIRQSNLKDRQTLLELGVRPSATYLANATIWVEGVSDCAYLRAYMEAFVHYLKLRGKDWGKRLVQRLEQYKEDRHYAFVEYNGSNLEHFSFENKEFDDGQAEAVSVRKISVPDLCATAIVIADGDVRGKGDRSTWLEEQLKERFICLPGKEIENLIPEALMKEQILYDHSPPKQKRVDTSLIELISYASYATPKAGIGKYLGDTVNIPTYKGTVGNGGASGTLPSNYKRRWRCEVEGIPALLRKAINPESIRPTPEQTDGANSVVDYGESIQIPDLPSYLTQDLIWLCVCLYVHIAKCNHDQEAEQKLKEFQQFIRDQGSDSKGPTGDPNDGKQPCVESGDPAESAVSEWPIKDVQRNCLLTTFLDSTSQPEATPNPHPEPQAQATSIPPGLTAYPASLNP